MWDYYEWEITLDVQTSFISSNYKTSFLVIVPQTSQPKFHQIRFTKTKVIHVQIVVPNWEKRKKWEKTGNKGGYKSRRVTGVTKRAIKGLQVEAGFRDYKWEQEGS